MAEHGYGVCEPLHIAPGRTATVTVKYGSFDLSYYEHSHMVVAWLGVHAVAVYDSKARVMLPALEVTAEMRRWGDALEGHSDDDTIVLTERGRVEANLLLALGAENGASNPL